MKKIISIILVLTLAFSMLVLTSCNNNDPDEGKDDKVELKLGLGVVVEAAATDYEEEDGAAELIVTAAAVLVNKDGKIVACALDTFDATAIVGVNGTVTAPTSLKTKGELGTDYGMSTNPYAPDLNGDEKVLEWNEQAAAFVKLCIGKNSAGVMALVANDGYYGTEEVQNAGCTIGVNAFANAVKKAIDNAKVEGATDKDTLKLAITASVAAVDAEGEEAGSAEFVVNVAAAAKNGKKVSAMYSDCVDAAFAVDNKGAVTAPTSLKTKVELGTAYGMSTNPYAQDLNDDGKVLEWNEQVKAFDNLCKGKDANGIKALALNTGYGVEDVQNAACTINIADLVKTAAKAAE